jgi:hypothetical protein
VIQRGHDSLPLQFGADSQFVVDGFAGNEATGQFSRHGRSFHPAAKSLLLRKI